MFNPKYRICITNEYFSEDLVICLGTQLMSIVNSIKDFLPPHTWYAADVDAMGKGARKYEGFQLETIGNALQFVEYCSEIDQFIWGVFLGIDNRFLSQNIQSIELGAEDEAFRPIPCDGILIEIRTFDTTWFEVYSDDFVLMRKISEK